jgi:hypothetical protein
LGKRHLSPALALHLVAAGKIQQHVAVVLGRFRVLLVVFGCGRDEFRRQVDALREEVERLGDRGQHRLGDGDRVVDLVGGVVLVLGQVLRLVLFLLFRLFHLGTGAGQGQGVGHVVAQFGVHRVVEGLAPGHRQGVLRQRQVGLVDHVEDLRVDGSVDVVQVIGADFGFLVVDGRPRRQFRDLEVFVQLPDRHQTFDYRRRVVVVHLGHFVDTVRLVPVRGGARLSAVLRREDRLVRAALVQLGSVLPTQVGGALRRTGQFRQGLRRTAARHLGTGRRDLATLHAPVVGASSRRVAQI